MKSVMIIDTPATCKECKLNHCQAWIDADCRPETCPLRPLPARVTQNIYEFKGYENGKAAGFNWCLEQIGG